MNRLQPKVKFLEKDSLFKGGGDLRVTNKSRKWAPQAYIWLFFVCWLEPEPRHRLVRIIAAQCCAIVGRDFFRTSLSHPPIHSLHFSFTSNSSFNARPFPLCWRLFICRLLARFHFLLHFRLGFCRCLVLRHTKKPRSRPGVYSGKDSGQELTFMMHLSWNISALASLFFSFSQTKNVVPPTSFLSFLYEKIKSNGIEITSPHM